MSIDSIFLKQFKANNKFINAIICSINNYLQASNMEKLLSCCELICDGEDTFEENNQTLNYLKEKIKSVESQLDKLEVEHYCIDSIQMFKLLVTYSKSIVDGESEEKTETIYKELMSMYDKYTLYKNKF